jgi:phosphoglycolate phosphatase
MNKIFNFNNIKAVIFDIDGTIMDSIGRIVECMQLSCKDMSVEAPSVQACKDIIGLTLAEAVDTLLPNFNEKLRTQTVQCYKDNYTKLEDECPTQLFKDTEAVFEQLHANGYKIGIATGKSRKGYNRVMGYTNLARYIDVSVTGDEVRSKPDQQMLLRACDKLLLPVKACLMVGDSVLDIGMANNALMPSAAVLTGVHDYERLSKLAPVSITENLTDLCNQILNK